MSRSHLCQKLKINRPHALVTSLLKTYIFKKVHPLMSLVGKYVLQEYTIQMNKYYSLNYIKQN